MEASARMTNIIELSRPMAKQAIEELNKRAARLSHCKDKKVGVWLFAYNEQLHRLDKLSCGYNGLKVHHTCKWCGNSTFDCMSVHAEIVALTNMPRHARAEVVFSTLEPCIACANALVYAGAKVVFFGKKTNPEKTGKHVWLHHHEPNVSIWEQV